MKAKTGKVIIWTAVITFAVTVFGAYMLSRGCEKGEGWSWGRISDTVTDTVVDLKRDTILKFRDRIIYKEAHPETVWVSKETVDVDTIWGRFPEAIVELDKKNHKLSFTSLFPADTWCNKALVKRYTYTVGNNFSIVAKGNGFFVKTPHKFWTQFYGGASAGTGFKLWGDSTMPYVDPYLRGYVGWGPINVGPMVTLHGIQVTAEAAWRF